MTGGTGQLIAGAKAVARAAAGPQGAAGALSFSLLLPSFFSSFPLLSSFLREEEGTMMSDAL